MEAQDRPASRLPPRKRGPHADKFRAVEIVSNHFEATLNGINQIVIFDFKITPRVQPKHKEKLKEIYNAVKPQVAARIKRPVFRGLCLFSSEQCPEPFTVKTGQFSVQVSQRRVHEVGSKPGVFLLFLNVSLRGIMSRMGYIQIGRSGKYFTSTRVQTIDNLKMYKGFTSSFQECEKGMLLRVDTARKIVRKDTVLETINSIYKQHSGKDKEEKRNQVKRALINAIVMTTYGKPAFYRIQDIEFKSLMDVPISDDIPNLKEYYLQRYNLEVKNEQQPLLSVENKIQRREKAGSSTGPTYLLPELCVMTGIPDNFDEMRRKSISQQTILNPSDKFREIEGYMGDLVKSKEIENLAQLGISLKTKMNRVSAKQIPNPALALGGNNFVEKNKEAFFNLFGQPVYSGKHNLAVCIVHTKYADIGPLVTTLEATAKRLKVELSIKKIETPMAKDRDVIAGIERAMKTFENTNILMVSIPGNLKTAYPRLKQQLLTVKAGKEMLSQFVVENTLKKKGVQSIHTKLLLQMIAKRGNILWVPSFNQAMSNVLSGTCIMGIDTATKGGASVMAACATTNSTFSLLASATLNTTTNKFTDMLAAASKCIEGYAGRNKRAPDELIVFMLAVPGDQVNLVQDNFCRPLEERVRENYQSQLRLTVVMVNLRNSERFFSQGNEARNVPPGTLISSQVVSKNYDFYIVSQQSNKGSVVPNHYKVIHSNSRLEEGHLQELIHSQCFNYANWSGSIKIPAILQYAKKCAKFNAEVMEGKEVSQALQTRPYFI